MQSVREANEADLPRIVELGSRSLIDGPYAGIIKDVPSQAEKCARMVMQVGKIMLGEDKRKVVGLLGFIFARHHFSDQPYAAEIMWYVEKEHRAGGIAMKLLWEAEKEARKMGAESFHFSAPNEDVSAIYQRFGYKKLEVTYQKAL